MTTTDTRTQLEQFIQANQYAIDPETVKAVKRAKRLLTLSYDEEQ
ncbi:MAG TPA: hypothetical protein V6C90_22735 [Coleofasciculaceae cyanobacterium]|jgi:hypothetical protein